jgi:hypothetical protein
MKIIHLECKPDETFAQSIGFTRKEIIHNQGRSRVCKNLEKGNNIYGIVDEDPGSEKPTYISELPPPQAKHHTLFYDDKARSNKLLMLRPNLEGWIIKIAKESGINMKDYGLPDTEKELHDVINFRLHKFKQLLLHLNTIKAPAFIYIKDLLK